MTCNIDPFESTKVGEEAKHLKIIDDFSEVSLSGERRRIIPPKKVASTYPIRAAATKSNLSYPERREKKARIAKG